MNVTHDELSELIELCYEKKLSLFVWGAMGIGKSETIRETAKRIAKKLNKTYVEYNKIRDKNEIENNIDKYFILVDFRLSQIEPSDLKGIPVPTDGTVVWKIPHALDILTNEKAHGILFFDELNLAHPSIQSSAYQIILDRVVGEKPLSDNVLVISAGNRIEDKANIFEMSAPLKNRFIHCELDISVDKWIEWAVNHNIDKRIVSFISSNNEFLFKFDSKMSDKAFPTPRSWEYASKLISGVEDINKVKKLVSHAVGEATALRFYAHLKLHNKININEYIEKPEKIKEIRKVAEKIDKENAEITEKELIYSILTELVYRIKNADNKKKLDLVKKALMMCQYIEPEFVAFTFKLIGKHAHEELEHVFLNEKFADEMFEKYKKYLL